MIGASRDSRKNISPKLFSTAFKFFYQKLANMKNLNIFQCQYLDDNFASLTLPAEEQNDIYETGRYYATRYRTPREILENSTIKLNSPVRKAHRMSTRQKPVCSLKITKENLENGYQLRESML